LADLGAVHHQTEMFRLNVPPAHFQALIHEPAYLLGFGQVRRENIQT
jgi:hypothetical protein